MTGSSFRRIVGPVAALVVAAAPLHAAPRISMTVDVGFNTICRPGRMVPCRITVDNPGNAFAGTLTAERQAGESKWRRTIKANVSAGGRSIYTTTCSSNRSYPDLVFSLFNENGRRVATPGCGLVRAGGKLQPFGNPVWDDVHRQSVQTTGTQHRARDSTSVRRGTGHHPQPVG
jgi:hypothetical protein